MMDIVVSSNRDRLTFRFALQDSHLALQISDVQQIRLPGFDAVDKN